MYVATGEIQVRRGASRRKKRLRRFFKRARLAVGIAVLLALILVCGWLGADIVSNLYIYGGTAAVRELLPFFTDGNADAENHTANGTGVHLAVNPVLQTPQLQNGCEATSLAMALQYLGYDADKTEIAYSFLPSEALAETGGTLYGPWPGEAYPGDPGTSRGFYCYAAPVADAGNAFLSAQGGGGTFLDATGQSLESLRASLDAGHPVVIWATLGYTAELEYLDFSWQLPDGRTYTPYANLHCVVLTGYSEDFYHLCDPLAGEIEIDRDTLAASYEAMGSRAVVYEV